jgi:hypothetical protein
MPTRRAFVSAAFGPSEVLSTSRDARAPVDVLQGIDSLSNDRLVVA